jgi:hypothetical protein
LSSSQRIYASGAAGAHYFLDTVSDPSGAFIDLHGFAPIVSAQLRWIPGWSRNFSWNVEARATFPSNDFHNILLSVGGAYLLANPTRLSPTQAAIEEDVRPLGVLDPTAEGMWTWTAPAELTLAVTRDTINRPGNPKFGGESLEFRMHFQRDIDATVTYLYEGDPDLNRRSSLFAELWVTHASQCPTPWVGCFHNVVDFAIGMGPYTFLATKTGAGQSPSAAAVVSALVDQRLGSNWRLGLIWDRLITTYNRDADVWRLGISRTLQ